MISDAVGFDESAGAPPAVDGAEAHRRAVEELLGQGKGHEALSEAQRITADRAQRVPGLLLVARAYQVLGRGDLSGYVVSSLAVEGSSEASSLLKTMESERREKIDYIKARVPRTRTAVIGAAAGGLGAVLLLLGIPGNPVNEVADLVLDINRMSLLVPLALVGALLTVGGLGTVGYFLACRFSAHLKIKHLVKPYTIKGRACTNCGLNRQGLGACRFCGAARRSRNRLAVQFAAGILALVVIPAVAAILFITSAARQLPRRSAQAATVPSTSAADYRGAKQHNNSTTATASQPSIRDSVITREPGQSNAEADLQRRIRNTDILFDRAVAAEVRDRAKLSQFREQVVAAASEFQKLKQQTPPVFINAEFREFSGGAIMAWGNSSVPANFDSMQIVRFRPNFEKSNLKILHPTQEMMRSATTMGWIQEGRSHRFVEVQEGEGHFGQPVPIFVFDAMPPAFHLSLKTLKDVHDEYDLARISYFHFNSFFTRRPPRSRDEIAADQAKLLARLPELGRHGKWFPGGAAPTAADAVGYAEPCSDGTTFVEISASGTILQCKDGRILTITRLFAPEIIAGYMPYLRDFNMQPFQLSPELQATPLCSPLAQSLLASLTNKAVFQAHHDLPELGDVTIVLRQPSAAPDTFRLLYRTDLKNSELLGLTAWCSEAMEKSLNQKTDWEKIAFPLGNANATRDPITMQPAKAVPEGL